MGATEGRIRFAVQAEMQEQQAASLSNGVYQPPRQNVSEGFPETRSSTRIVKLCFVDVERPKDPVYTDCPVQWQNGANTKVEIFENESQITQGDLSKLQIEILPVRDDFFTERGQANFTKEEFNKQIYMCKGKELVLTTVNLINGEACLSAPFVFTESSFGKKLRLAARVKSQDLAVRVQEAITYPFVVKVCRSKLNEKSYPPSKEEGVHCLEEICLKGKRCKDLAVKNITTVKHLLRYYHRDESGLQKITGMKKENWNTMIKHATTSDPGDEIYSYKVAEENVVLLFNDFYDLVGMIVDGSYVPYSVNNLDQLQQLKVNNWKTSAHKKFEYLEKSGSLIPDYVMSNGLPEVFPNNDASPSIQARPTWQCPDDRPDCTSRIWSTTSNSAAEWFLTGSLAHVFPNNDAGPSTQTILPLQQYAYEQTMHQDHLDPYYLTQGNILNGQCSGSGQSTIPSHNILPIQEDNLIIGANLSAQHNRYSGSLTTDAAGTSPVIDGASQQTSLPNHVQTDVVSGLSPIEEWPEPNYGHEADQGFLAVNNESAAAETSLDQPEVLTSNINEEAFNDVEDDYDFYTCCFDEGHPEC